MEREPDSMVGLFLPKGVAEAVRQVGECNAPATMLIVMGVWSHHGRTEAEAHKVWAGLVLVLCGRLPVTRAASDAHIRIRRETLRAAVNDFRRACKAVGVGAIAGTVKGVPDGE